MKKLLSISAILLAAALVFTGCSNPSSGESGPRLPGSWTNSINFYEDLSENNWTRKNNKISFTCNDPTSLNIEDGYTSFRWLPIASNNVYGVDVKIKQKYFTGAECGITLFSSGNTNNNSDAYYSLTLWDGSYILYEKESGKARIRLSGNDKYQNTFNDAIKEEGSENEILFYSEGTELVLKINGTEITRFTNKLSSGICNAYMAIPSTTVNPIKVDWDFVNFQTAK